MQWEPIKSEELEKLINDAIARMDSSQRRLWKAISITPEKWKQLPYGDEGGGFWVVAVIGKMVIWYNDIEDGFNRSRYKVWGTIEEYYCNKDELEWSVQQVSKIIETGYDDGLHLGEPEAV